MPTFRDDGLHCVLCTVHFILYLISHIVDPLPSNLASSNQGANRVRTDRLESGQLGQGQFTLTAMSYIALAVPFVLAYIAWVWRLMDAKKLDASEFEGETAKELY